ncbi:MAG: polysaccharide deacetylase family protein, partial [Actinobacteria bacterium]|nr:polysaccharide deacetylase family protein [Actinomycetota bacterium]
AGGSVTAPLSAPGKAQLRLAKRALLTAKSTASGGLVATIRAGITAPELVALGVGPTSASTSVSVDRATADSWSSRVGRLLRDAAGKRFVGVREPEWSVKLDCRLLPCVALTYDDGPGQYTTQLGSTLRKQQARVTFFMIGSNIPGREAIVRRVVAGGHEIGSHTMHHPDLTRLSLRAAKAEVLDAAALIRKASGQPVTLFRPPYGAINERIIRKVGLPAIVWNVDTNDWRLPGRAALVQRSVPVVQVGGIILFHDIHPDSVAVAGKVVTGLRDRGFELVTVSQLFGGKVPLARISGRY